MGGFGKRMAHNHVNEMNNQILNNSGTIELFRCSDGSDMDKKGGKNERDASEEVK